MPNLVPTIPSLPAKLTAAALRASGVTPFEIDLALEDSLAQRFGVRLVEKGLRQTGEPAMRVVRLKSSSTHDIEAAWRWLQGAMEPASEAEIERTLAVVSQLVARGRGGDDEAADLQLEAYVAKLRRYPADIALAVLNRWPDTERFWPTWSEIKARLDRLTWRRRQMLEALETERPENPARELARSAAP